MNIQLTRTEIWVGCGLPIPRSVLLPEIGVKAYRRSYPQKTTEAKIEAYKQDHKGFQKLKFDPYKVAADYFLSN